MGFLSKVVKSATKAVSGAVKSAVKLTGKVLNSKAFQIAATAMCFIPGLNAAGLVGKSLSLLGKASTIQKWMTTGMKVFNAIKNGKGITDVVKNLMSGKFQPLGALSSLLGGMGPLGNLTNCLKIANSFQPKLGMLQDGVDLLKQAKALAGDHVELAHHLIPAGWSELTSGIGGGIQSDFVNRIENLQSRLQFTTRMFEEITKLVNPRPLQGLDYIVRA